MVGTPTAKCTQHPGWGGMMWSDTHRVAISLKGVFLLVAFHHGNIFFPWINSLFLFVLFMFTASKFRCFRIAIELTFFFDLGDLHLQVPRSKVPNCLPPLPRPAFQYCVHNTKCKVRGHST